MGSAVRSAAGGVWKIAVGIVLGLLAVLLIVTWWASRQSRDDWQNRYDLCMERNASVAMETRVRRCESIADQGTYGRN